MIVGCRFARAVYSKIHVEKETPNKEAIYYSLMMLQITGLAGICLTGDAFNLCDRSSGSYHYGLIAMGSKGKLLATYNYLILGTIGASLYLLGVGYLYIKTGTKYGGYS